MIEDDGPLGLTGLAVPLAGAVQATGDPFEPYRLVDSAGEPVLPVAVFLADLQACGRAAATQRSYSMALLRWFRFLWAVDVPWDQATRVEARDFVRWVQVAGKPERRHWRESDDAAGVRPGVPVPNRVTGKSPPGPQYAAATVAHAETVARTFYDFHLQGGPGPAGRMPITIRWTGSAGSGPGCSGRGWPSGSRGRFRTASSMSCSPHWARTGTGRCWRSGSLPGHAHPSCWACCPGAWTRASS